MDISKYDQKYVRIKDIYGETFTGLACYGVRDFLMHEYGGDEDGIFIEKYLIYNSQIESIEEIEVHGTAELWTERLMLRRYCPEDAEQLYQHLGTDPGMYQYSGWNPYATPEMAKETVNRFIDSYDDEHTYSWVMDVDDVVIGTIGAYDYECDRIEVGFSVKRSWQGRGYATEALRKVIEYLTENEGISCVTAWCAAENTGSRRVLEKSGMKLVDTEKDGIKVGDRVYDRLIYEYRKTPAGDEIFMQRAIELSASAVAHGNEPFGAVLVKDGKIVFENENQIYSKHDPTFHGEAGLIRRFCEETGITDLREYTLYSSCEPCFMCSGALVWVKIGRLVYGANNIELEEILGNTGCNCSKIVFDNSFWKPEVTAGVLREQALEILRDYFGKHTKG